MNTTQIGREFEKKAVEWLKKEGFTEVKRMPTQAPYDIQAVKDGKQYFIEVRGRRATSKTQFFTFRDTKIKHLLRLNKAGQVYVMLINKQGIRFVSLLDLLSGKHTDIHFFRYKGTKGYYWRTGRGWRKRDTDELRVPLTIRSCSLETKIAFKVLAARLDENYEETLKRLLELEKEHPLEKKPKGLITRLG